MKSIQTRLMSIVVAGIALLLMVSLSAILMLNSIVNEYRTLIDTNVSHEREIHAINLNFKTQVQEWKNVLLRGEDPTQLDTYWGRFMTLQDSIQARTGALLGDMGDSPARQTLNAFRNSHQQLATLYQNGRDAYVNSFFDFRAGDQAVSGIDREPTTLLQSAADQLSEANESVALLLSQRSAQVATWTLVLVVLMSAIVLAVVWITIRRGFITPLLGVLASIKGLAEGNFRQKFNSNREDELGQLGNDLAHMQAEIAGIIGAVQSTTDELHKASTTITRSADQIVGHTSETEICAEQVAAAITEMSQTVQEVAGNASSVASSAEQVDQASRNGLQHMQRTIDAINALSSDIGLVSQAMSRLENDAAAIGAVLDVIRGIAEQTNLLALNAAIEAARAGDQGRGFAVVADEVRALAKRTQESTAEIQQIIQNVQGGASHAANAMRQGSARSDSTVALAHESGESLREITQAISHIKDMMMHIATAAEEQSYATEEINKNVVTVVNLVQSSHSSALQSAKIANGLDGTSMRLQHLVQRFAV